MKRLTQKLLTILVLTTIASASGVGHSIAQRAIEIDELTVLSFGTLAVRDPDVAASYQILANGGAVDNNVIVLADPGGRGEFSVTGSANTTVVVSFPLAPIPLNCQEAADSTCVAGNALMVTNFDTNFVDNRIVLVRDGGGGPPPGANPPGGGPAATQTFFVGADLQIPAGTPDGFYTGTYTVTINYE